MCIRSSSFLLLGEMHQSSHLLTTVFFFSFVSFLFLTVFSISYRSLVSYFLPFLKSDLLFRFSDRFYHIHIVHVSLLNLNRVLWWWFQEWKGIGDSSSRLNLRNIYKSMNPLFTLKLFKFSKISNAWSCSALTVATKVSYRGTKVT